ncbi:hypothetical protein BD779DRAFT_1538824 [Infundibulicybe gibba]|nr:hypothetical protein BD779DRAFT_1538824 [Infundibulicybe gibba]
MPPEVVVDRMGGRAAGFVLCCSPRHFDGWVVDCMKYIAYHQLWAAEAGQDAGVSSLSTAVGLLGFCGVARALRIARHALPGAAVEFMWPPEWAVRKPGRVGRRNGDWNRPGQGAMHSPSPCDGLRRPLLLLVWAYSARVRVRARGVPAERSTSEVAWRLKGALREIGKQGDI